MYWNILGGDLHKWERCWESISNKYIESKAIKQKRHLITSEKTELFRK